MELFHLSLVAPWRFSWKITIYFPYSISFSLQHGTETRSIDVNQSHLHFVTNVIADAANWKKKRRWFPFQTVVKRASIYLLTVNPQHRILSLPLTDLWLMLYAKTIQYGSTPTLAHHLTCLYLTRQVWKYLYFNKVQLSVRRSLPLIRKT